jgi:hypothetical protein
MSSKFTSPQVAIPNAITLSPSEFVHRIGIRREG